MSRCHTLRAVSGHDNSPFTRIAAIAAKQDNVIDHRLARRAGLTQRQIDWLVANRVLQRMHTGVFIHGSSKPTWRQEMRAAILAGGKHAIASHRAGCAAYGVMPESVVEVTVPFEIDLVLAGGVVHRSRRGLTHTRVVQGIRVCSVERALLDAASVCSEVEIETAMEAALLRQLTTEQRLWVTLVSEGGRGVPGSFRFRSVLENRPDGRPARSVLEVLTSGLLRKNGVGGFVRNFRVTALDGTTFEIDFAFVDRMVALEVDGKAFHSTRSQSAKDKKRQRQLEALGWRFLRVGWHDVVLRPQWVLEQLAVALQANCALAST